MKTYRMQQPQAHDRECDGDGITFKLSEVAIAKGVVLAHVVLKDLLAGQVDEVEGHRHVPLRKLKHTTIKRGTAKNELCLLPNAPVNVEIDEVSSQSSQSSK